MAIVKSRSVLGVWREIRAFLSLDIGITRGMTPDEQAHAQIRWHQRRLFRRDQQVERRNKQIEQIRKRLSERNEQLNLCRNVLQKEKNEVAALKDQLGELKRQMREFTVESCVPFEGTLLPPSHLRFCGAAYRDDGHFLESARADVEKLVAHLGLAPESSVLDVGCGPGRLPIGILDKLGEIRKYRGIDVDELSIRWCQRHITSKHPNLKFDYVDVKNSRYNPDGTEIGYDFRFPFAEDEFDVIYLYSVFSHMLAEDVEAYLRDFQRILKPSGGVFLTAFVEDGVPDVTENPEGYRMKWEKPLHCVRYDRGFFEKLLAENGFVIERFDYATESDGQSALYISKSSG